MKKFAMLGKWHVHAPGYAREINGIPDCKVVKVWDPDEETARKWAEELGCESASAENILADPEIEGVVFGTATNEHTDLIIRACAAGKAVFTEKVLALTSAETEKIRRAIEENHTRFAISLPHFCDPATQFVLNAAWEGKLGKINYARVRKAHNGATGDWLPAHFYDPIACGGGAMIDLGAHPMYLLCAIMQGEPLRVQSTFTKITGRAVEDNAVSLLQFADGAIGVSETSFVSKGYPITIEIGGAEGTICRQNDRVEWSCAETENQWKPVENLPERLPSPIVQWARANTPEEIPEIFGVEAAMRLTRVMEMAYAAQ